MNKSITADQVAKVLNQARKSWDNEWNDETVSWDAKRQEYDVTDNVNWQNCYNNEPDDNGKIYISPEEMNEPRLDYMRDRVKETFGEMPYDVLDEAFELEAEME